MKNTIRFLGLIALVAVVGFAMTSCPGGGEKEGEGEKEPIVVPIPVATDFIIGNLTQVEGNVTAVTISPKGGKSTGAITIYYDYNIMLPTAVGEYQVTFDVAAIAGWNKATGLDGGTLTINERVNAQTPAITSQPSGATVIVSTSYSLSVIASVTDGGELSYQWYNNTSASTTDGTSLGSGAMSMSYNPLTDTVGIYYYFVEVTNTIPDNGDGGEKTATIRSEAVTLTVNNKVNAQTPAITSQPVSAMIPLNALHSLSVSANVTDGGVLSYQWYSNISASNSGGTSLGSGAMSRIYSPPTNEAGAFYYFVEITNTITNNGDGGNKIATVRSNAVEIDIRIPSPSEFVINLTSLNEWELTEQTAQAAANTNKIFTVTGTYTTYRWYLDGTQVGTSSSYTFNKPVGVYQLVVVVTNSNGESRSGRCWVTVTNP